MRKVVERDLVPLGAPQRRHMIHGGEFDLQQINRVSSLLVLVFLLFMLIFGQFTHLLILLFWLLVLGGINLLHV
jgi:hypothetical protein